MSGTTTGRARFGARSDVENVPIERLQTFYKRVLPAGQYDRDHRDRDAPAPQVLPDAQGQSSLRCCLQPHAVRARKLRPPRAWSHLKSLGISLRSASEYHQGETRRAVRGRVGAIPTDAGLHAATQRIRAARMARVERVLPRASALWIRASLEQRQRLQRLFLPGRCCLQRKSLRSNRRNLFSRRVLTAA